MLLRNLGLALPTCVAADMCLYKYYAMQSLTHSAVRSLFILPDIPDILKECESPQ
jgi:hypothetical protein